jgi:hypothetical protein
MNVKELKELIADLDDDMEVFIDGDHQGTSNCVAYHVGYVYGEDQYDMSAVDEEDLIDDPDNDLWDKYFIGDVVPGIILYGVA